MGGTPGSFELDSYVVDVLMPDLVGHDRRPSAFLVYLHLWREAGGAEGAGARRSLRQIADGTGLSRRAVQSAVARLKRRRLIEIERPGLTSVPLYRVRRPWTRRVAR